MGIIKRWLGSNGNQPLLQSQEETAELLRDAARTKSESAGMLRGAGHHEARNDLAEIAGHKERDAELLRQLAAELEIGRDEWR